MRGVFPGIAAELEALNNNSRRAAFGARLLVIPFLAGQSALNQNRAALPKELVDGFGGGPERLALGEVNVLPLLAGFGLPFPVVGDGQVEDGRSLGRYFSSGSRVMLPWMKTLLRGIGELVFFQKFRVLVRHTCKPL
jgi:hypothetical protein